MVGLVGAGLFYGDGMVTPAISVLAAVEGLEVAAPSLGSVSFFVAMWRNQTDPAGYFDLPEEQTVTMGALVEL